MAVARKPLPPARLQVGLEHESSEILARVCEIFGTFGKSSVRSLAVCPLAGKESTLPVTDAPVSGSQSLANTNAVDWLGLAMAMPVFRAASVSAAKSVAASVPNAGSTPTSVRRAGPDRNCRIT